MIYDVAIVGSGPAGLSAALNIKIRNKSLIWFGSKQLSDKISKAERISNYPGLINVTGAEMSRIFQMQIEETDVLVTQQMVTSIVSFRDHYALVAGEDFFEAKTVILATGVTNAKTLPGEEALLGKGVSYCATCDGNLYAGKTIGVLCNNVRFEHEVRYLAELADKVYYFSQHKNTGSFPDNVCVVSGRISAVLGETRVSGLALTGGEIIPVDGLFCLRDAVSLTTLLPKLTTDKGHIVVDRQMATNLPGVFAAGDCTGHPYQYAVAVGEGNIAAHSAIAYLDKI